VALLVVAFGSGGGTTHEDRKVDPTEGYPADRSGGHGENGAFLGIRRPDHRVRLLVFGRIPPPAKLLASVRDDVCSP
jgi:hypothetical protein